VDTPSALPATITSTSRRVRRRRRRRWSATRRQAGGRAAAEPAAEPPGSDSVSDTDRPLCAIPASIPRRNEAAAGVVIGPLVFPATTTTVAPPSSGTAPVGRLSSSSVASWDRADAGTAVRGPPSNVSGRPIVVASTRRASGARGTPGSRPPRRRRRDERATTIAATISDVTARERRGTKYGAGGSRGRGDGCGGTPYGRGIGRPGGRGAGWAAVPLRRLVRGTPYGAAAPGLAAAAPGRPEEVVVGLTRSAMREVSRQRPAP
jgi:hypothetical protein